ncbi:hypothetical protein G5V59_00360 [Nocardioides sp. W3-2-3]|uniref:hypothetical protein n=1 Tax=Nocardioides convexus TaxID=2712224 RepID=UPI0024189BCA|nr:hypothetical protein [Nocardioides convexus]NGZ99423.1 hypothetical protein [Nocardioides convexus]
MNGSNLHAAWIGETVRPASIPADDIVLATTILLTESQVIDFLLADPEDGRADDMRVGAWRRAYEIKYAKGPAVEAVTPPAFLRYAPDSGGSVVKGQVEGGGDQ